MIVLQALGAAFALVTVLVLTAVLGAEGYGRYVWIVSAGGIGSLLLQRGQPTTLVKRFAPLDLGAVTPPSELANTQALYAIGTAITIVLAALMARVSGADVVWALPVAFGLASLTVSDAILRAAERGVRAQFASQFLRPVTLLAGALLLWQTGIIDPAAYLLLYAATAFLASVIYLWPLTVMAVRNRRGAGLVKTNGAHFQVSLSRSIGNHLPIFITGFFIPFDALAYLAVAIRLSGPVIFGVTAARAYFGARINRHVKAGEIDSVRRDFRAAALFSLLVGLLAAAGVSGLILGLGYFGLGPVADFTDRALLISVFALVMAAQLCRAAVGPVQLTAILLGAERFVRNYSIATLLGLAGGLALAGLTGDVRVSAGIVLLYALAISVGFGIRTLTALRTDKAH